MKTKQLLAVLLTGVITLSAAPLSGAADLFPLFEDFSGAEDEAEDYLLHEEAPVQEDSLIPDALLVQQDSQFQEDPGLVLYPAPEEAAPAQEVIALLPEEAPAEEILPEGSLSEEALVEEVPAKEALAEEAILSDLFIDGGSEGSDPPGQTPAPTLTPTPVPEETP